MKKKVILTTEQIERVFEQNLDTDNVPTIDIDVDGANIGGDITTKIKDAATDLGTDTYNVRIIPDTTTQNGNNVELVGKGNSIPSKVDDFNNQYQNVPNKQNAIGMINVDSSTVSENIVYTKAKVEEMKADNLKKTGTIMTLKEFNEYLKK